MRRLCILSLAVLLAFGGCGGSDDDGGGGEAKLDAAALQTNLEAAGYTLNKSSTGELPATLGSFAANPGSGFQSGYSVSGKGLDPASSTTVANTVTILLYDSADNAKKAFDQLGGDTDNRKLSGNRIYLYGGGVNGTPSPKLQPVIDVSESQ